MIRQILRYVTPTVGRFSESQLVRLGQILQPCAFLNIGPVVVLLDLPELFQRHDPAQVPASSLIPSLDDLNKAARAASARLGTSSD